MVLSTKSLRILLRAQSDWKYEKASSASTCLLCHIFIHRFICRDILCYFCMWMNCMMYVKHNIRTMHCDHNTSIILDSNSLRICNYSFNKWYDYKKHETMPNICPSCLIIKENYALFYCQIRSGELRSFNAAQWRVDCFREDCLTFVRFVWISLFAVCGRNVNKHNDCLCGCMVYIQLMIVWTMWV